MRFENPETGEELQIDFTIGLSEMLSAARPVKCIHDDLIVRARTIQGGGIQIKQQCTICGQPVGNPRRKVDFPDAPPFDEALLKRNDDEEKRSRWIVAQSYLALRDRGDLEFQQEYQSYLASSEWKRKRSHILKRCRGICEGCMEKQAAEVHHLSYRHFGAEFLFELVGLCNSCHDRIHDTGQQNDSNERPCRGCRYQGGDGINCPLFGVTEDIALSDERYCGPKRVGFAPLK
jgi:hypothetical protein